MYEAQSRCSKGGLVCAIQELPQGERNKLMKLLKQNMAAVNEMVEFVQKQHQPPKDHEQKQNGRGLGPNVGRARDLHLRLCFCCHKKAFYGRL